MKAHENVWAALQPSGEGRRMEIVAMAPTLKEVRELVAGFSGIVVHWFAGAEWYR